MKKIIKELIVYGLSKLISGGIKGEKIDEVGIAVGVWITDNCKDGLGDNWNKVEDVLQAKFDRFMNAVHTGLDSDD